MGGATRRWAAYWRRYGDAAIAGAIASVFAAETLLEADTAGHRGASAAVALAFGGSLLLRRRAPLVPLLAGLAVIELDNTVLKGLAEAGAFLVGYIVAIYSAGRYARGLVLWLALTLVVLDVPLAAIEPGQPVGFADVAFFAVFFGGPFVAGRVIRARRERERSLEVERDEAVADERSRIARELHDVVAHAIGVIVLQARGGRRLLDESPEDTRRALDTIERAGEQALAEMRRLLGLLRDDDELALAPQPSLSRVGELAARLTATGLPVEVSVEGEPAELPPGVDVSAYRIVQEALTNALKHAGPASAHVTIRYEPDALELEIVDDGAGNGSGGGSGHGLAGIRERVAVYGGELESGRSPDGGYALRARLPLDGAR
jgi:signal transduction histidine kinase